MIKGDVAVVVEPESGPVASPTVPRVAGPNRLSAERRKRVEYAFFGMVLGGIVGGGLTIASSVAGAFLLSGTDYDYDLTEALQVGSVGGAIVGGAWGISDGLGMALSGGLRPLTSSEWKGFLAFSGAWHVPNMMVACWIGFAILQPSLDASFKQVSLSTFVGGITVESLVACFLCCMVCSRQVRNAVAVSQPARLSPSSASTQVRWFEQSDRKQLQIQRGSSKRKDAAEGRLPGLVMSPSRGPGRVFRGPKAGQLLTQGVPKGGYGALDDEDLNLMRPSAMPLLRAGQRSD